MKICPSQKGFIHAQILGKTNSEHSYWLWQYIKYYIFGRQVDIDQDFRKLIIISPFHFFQNLHTTLAHPPFVYLHPLFVPLSPSRCTLTLSGSIPAASCSPPESSLYCSSTFTTDCKCPKLSVEVFREIIWWEPFLNLIVHRIGKIAKTVNTENLLPQFTHKKAGVGWLLVTIAESLSQSAYLQIFAIIALFSEGLKKWGKVWSP